MSAGDGSNVTDLRCALVDKLTGNGCINTVAVEEAFLAVPRHLFLPGVPLDRVYSDEAIPTKHHDGLAISSSSQPAIMAIMLEQLGLEPGQRVLEIGAGTGYNAALMAHLVDDTGRVFTVDIDGDIVDGAREHLRSAGFDRVQVVRGDGALGYPEAAPYDRIILTVGAWDLAPAWLEQLRAGGRLVLPLTLRGGVQQSVAFERAGDYLTSVSLAGCGFMRMRGTFAGPEVAVPLGPDPGLCITVEDRNLVEPAVAYRWLTGPSHDRPAAARVTPGEIWGGLSLWLALREPGLCGLTATGRLADSGIVPCLFGYGGESKSCFTSGLLGEGGLCVLIRQPGQTQAPGDPAGPEPFDLHVRSFGPDDTLSHRLIEQIAAWDAAGRPSTKGLSIRAYPREDGYAPSASEAFVDKRWTRLVLTWQ